MIDMQLVRKASWAVVETLGFAKSDALPLLDELSITRSQMEVVNRVLAMHCVAASAVGFDRRESLAWVEREGCYDSLTPSEGAFLRGAETKTASVMHQVEGMWALCWSLKVVADLDFSKPCSDIFVTLLPDLKKAETAATFRAKAALRGHEEVIRMCDLSYCLHWAVTQGRLRARRIVAVAPYVIVERRRALEWLCSKDSWDDVSLDT